MTVPAVGEKPNVQSATEDSKPIDTEAALRAIAESTDDGGESQTDDGAGDDDTNQDDPDNSSPDGEGDNQDDREEDPRFKAWQEAERERLIEEGRELERNERTNAARTEEGQVKVNEAKQKFPDALEKFNAKVAELSVDPKIAEQLLAPIKAYNLEAQDIFTELAYGELQDAFLAGLPADQHADYIKAVDNKPADVWLKEYIERKALETDAHEQAHKAFIEDLTKDEEKVFEAISALSPKVKAFMAKLRADEFQAGRAEERKRPSREPIGDEAGTITGDDLPKDASGKIDTRRALAAIQRSPARR